MRSVLFFLLFAFSLTGCKKEDKEEDTTPRSYSDKIVLNEPVFKGDSVTLNWSVLENTNFRGYAILRKEDPADNPQNAGFVYDPSTTTLVDKAVPYSSYVQYQVIAQLSTGQVITSNPVVLNRPEIKSIAVSPFDVQLDKPNRLLYFFEKTGTISIYSLQTNQIVKSINTAATIGYCDFGMYNGVKELYVPRNDGWVFIYNAETLEKIDQINIGLQSSCVVANNNILYVSSAAWTNRPLKVYNRATKTKVSETGDFELTRFKKVPNSNTELIEITLNIGPTDVDYYSFTSTGGFLQHFNDFYHGDYPLNANIFEFFPSGNKFITSSSGSIYSKNMTYEANLPRGNKEFSCFDFDAQKQQIFGGTYSKTIEVYSELNYNHIRSIPTKAYPFRIFNDGANGILCLNSSSMVSMYDPAPKKLIIEMVK